MESFEDFPAVEAAPQPAASAESFDDFPAVQTAAANPQRESFDNFAPVQGNPQRESFDDFAPAEARPKLDMRTIYDDPETQRVASEYYSEADGKPVEARDAISRMIHTGRRADSNTAQNLFEMADTRLMSDEQKRRFAFLRQRFQDLPSFWQEGGSGAAGLAENVAYGIADPVNYAGGPLLRGALRLGGKATSAARAWLGGTTAGRITGTTAADGVISAAGNLANQNVENQVGMREGYSLGEAGLAGVVGAGLSGAGNVLATRFGRTQEAVPSTGNRDIDPLLGKIGENPDATRDGSIVGLADKVNTEVFDSLTPAAVIQEKATGIGRDARSLKAAELDAVRTGGMSVGSLPFVRGRLLAASTERSDQIVMENTFLPAEHRARAGTAEAGYSRITGEGLKPILDFIESKGIHPEHLNLFGNAMRAKWLRDARNPMLTAKALQNPTGGPAKTIGSYFDDASIYMKPGVSAAQAQQMAAASIDNTIQTLGQVPGMREAFDRLQGLWGRVGEYSIAGQVTNIDQLARMRGAGIPVPHGVEFAYMPWLPAKSGRDDMLRAVAGGKIPDAGGSPIRKRLTGNMGNRMPAVEAWVTYIKRSVASADRNLFDLSVVDTVMDGQAANAFDGKPVMVKLDAQKSDAMMNIARADAEAALNKAGNLHPTPDEIDLEAASILADRRGSSNTGSTPRKVVFRNGVAEIYEVADPTVARMFEAQAPEEISRLGGWMRTVARWRSDLITTNPVFVGKDFIRNTISSSVNSQFGFAPILSSLQGLGTVIKGSRLNPHDASRTATHAMLQEARRSGVGFSHRRAQTMIAEAGGDPTKYSTLADYAQSNFLVKGWRGWLEISNQIEMAARISEYAMARKAGLSGPVAGFLGREVATDFAARGANSKLRGFSGVSSFLNASLQGGHRAYRALAHEKTPLAAAGIISTIVLPMIALHAYNAGQEGYDNLTPEQKAQGLWFTAPRDWQDMQDYITGAKNDFAWESDGGIVNGVVQDNHVPHRSPEAKLVSIPIPQEFAAIGAVFNGIVEAVRTSDATKGVEGLYRGLMGAIPGIHLPDAIQPVAQLGYTNKDGLGRDITPPQLESAPAAEQAVPGRTAEWAIDLGQLQEKLTRSFRGEGREGLVALTPIEIDYIAKHFLPGLGGLFLQGAGQVGRNEGRLGEAPAGRDEDFDLRNPTTAVTRGFIRSGEGQDPAVGELYTLNRRSDAAAKANRSSMENPRTRDAYGARDVSDERQLLENLPDVFRSGVAGMRQFSAAIAEAEANPRLSPQEKRREIDTLNAQRNAAARQTMDALKKSPDLQVLFRTRLNPNPAENTGERNLIREPPAFLRRLLPNGSP